MDVAIIGTGYVGLTTGVCLALLGHEVRCHDVDPGRMDKLARGRPPIYEPGMEQAMRAAARKRSLHFVSELADAVRGAKAVFLSVGTPSLPDGDIDLSYLEAAARQIAPLLAPFTTVVVKSTVTVGSCRRLEQIIRDVRGAGDFAVAANPEFLREGSAIDDFMHPDRIIIGSDDERATTTLKELYGPLVARTDAPVLVTSAEDAEMVKHAANAFLAMKIGFINEVADLCERTGADVTTVAKGIGLDQRIGPAFLQAGPGFGGSCFPKDARAFAATGRRNGVPQSLVETLIEGNDRRKTALARRIAFKANLRKGAVVAVLGVAFKAATDDVRESPALAFIPALQDQGFVVRAFDPQAMPTAAKELPDVNWCSDAYEAATGADAVVILTDWKDFTELDLGRLSERMKGSTLFDFRNILQPEAVAACGMTYFGVGRAGLPGDKRQYVEKRAVAAAN